MKTNQTLNKFAVCAVVMGSLIATGCDGSKRPSPPDKAVPKATNPYRGGDQPPLERTTSDAVAALDNADTVNFETKNECAINICGPLFNKEKSTQANPELSETIKERTAKLKPLIESAISLDQELNLLLVQKFDELKPQIASVKLEEGHKAVINMFWMFSHAAETFPLWGETSFDEPELRKVLLEKHLSTAEINSFIEMATYYFNSEDFKTAKSIELDGFDTFLSTLAKSQDMKVKKEAARVWAQELLRKLKALNSKFPLLFTNDFPAVEAIAAGKDLDASLLKLLSGEVGESFMYSVMVKNVGTFIKRDIDLQAIATDYDATVRERKMKLLSPDIGNRRVAMTLNYCGKAIYGLNALTKYEDAALAGAPAQIQKVREQVVKVVDELSVDAAVIAEVKRKVAETRFDLPLKSDARMGLLVSGANEEIKDVKEQLEVTRKGSSSELALMMAAEVYNGSDNSEPVAQLCINLDPMVSTDNSKSGFGQIQLSWRTLLQPKTGYGVIAHEFGHEISAQLKKNKQNVAGLKYADAVGCVTDRKGVQEIRSSEEDFADLVAVKATRHLKEAQVDAGNFACVLMNRDDSRWGTDSGLALNWPTGIKDTHSTSFYRAIQYEIDSGNKLSASCETVVTQGKPSMAKTCL